MNFAQAIADAWRIAADDLGIKVVAGGTLNDRTGDHHRYTVHVADFGKRKGTIGLARGSDEEHVLEKLARDQGYYFSVLYDSYAAYDRTLFTETLDDWQWCGAGDPPGWYTGKPWTS